MGIISNIKALSGLGIFCDERATGGRGIIVPFSEDSFSFINSTSGTATSETDGWTLAIAVVRLMTPCNIGIRASEWMHLFFHHGLNVNVQWSH